MSGISDLTALSAVTHALYEKEQHSFQKIVTEELGLRQELAGLDNFRRGTASGNADAAEMRAIGADILWQAWVARERTRINMKLAKVLAVKEHHLVQVRHAYGKVMVINELISRSTAESKKKLTQDGLSRAIDQALFS